MCYPTSEQLPDCRGTRVMEWCSREKRRVPARREELVTSWQGAGRHRAPRHLVGVFWCWHRKAGIIWLLTANWKIQSNAACTRTRTNTNPNGTEANAARRSGNARALRKQSKCGMIQEGEGHWPNSSKNLQKARNLWVLRSLQNNKEEGARAKKLVTCGTRGPLGRGQSVPFSAQGAYCSAPEP